MPSPDAGRKRVRLAIGRLRNACLPALGTLRNLSRLKPVLASLKKGFSLIVAPHGTGAAVTFDLPANAGVMVLVLVAVFLAGIAFVGITYTKLAFLAVQATKLRVENAELRKENGKIREIQAELARIESVKQQIEAWVGITESQTEGGGSASVGLRSTNDWPRRYTYAIMKPFYEGGASYSKGMLLPADGWISRSFSGGGEGKAAHPGIDIVAARGTPVRCALDGVVKSARWDDTYGNVVVVAHADSLQTVYGHNDRILVKEGDHVTKGQIIAVLGSTGRSTAPHLHFEVLKGDKPVDPGTYLDLTRS
jgi:murein DD-endopeptidase MepM/ murein hydrolase activator NlpD